VVRLLASNTGLVGGQVALEEGLAGFVAFDLFTSGSFMVSLLADRRHQDTSRG
jgi:hypothetical protein